MFSLLIVYEHTDPITSPDGRSPYSMVTALVDELLVHEPNIDPKNDIVMHGHVSWVGYSSIEVTMYMSQFDKTILETKFLMVAVDPSTGKASPVHPLKATTDEEKRMIEGGNKRKLERKERAKVSLFTHAPTAVEMSKIHEMFLTTVRPTTNTFESRILPENCKWSGRTKLKNSAVCFPEHRNVHNNIFGGFTMRLAFELAWSNAYIFTRKRPVLKAIDDIIFQTPIEIGSLVMMTSQICVADPPYYLARVVAEVFNKKTGELRTSNLLHFTFTSEAELNLVMPYSYGEAMVYIDGFRRLQKHKNRFEEYYCGDCVCPKNPHPQKPCSL